MFPEETVNGRSFYVFLQTATPVHRHLPSTGRGHKKFPTPRNKHIVLSNVQINRGHNFFLFLLFLFPCYRLCRFSGVFVITPCNLLRSRRQTWTVTPSRPTLIQGGEPDQVTENSSLCHEHPNPPPALPTLLPEDGNVSETVPPCRNTRQWTK
jgi:hypothetical protein